MSWSLAQLSGCSTRFITYFPSSLSAMPTSLQISPKVIDGFSLKHSNAMACSVVTSKSLLPCVNVRHLSVARPSVSTQFS